MPKILSVNVPVDGTIIISRRKKKNGDPAQLDCFDGYSERWINKMVEFIRSFPRPVRMSVVRKQAGINGMEAPLSKNWYGKAMQLSGLKIIGYDKSPIKSRRGGVEAIWQ